MGVNGVKPQFALREMTLGVTDCGAQFPATCHRSDIISHWLHFVFYKWNFSTHVKSDACHPSFSVNMLHLPSPLSDAPLSMLSLSSPGTHLPAQ